MNVTAAVSAVTTSTATNTKKGGGGFDAARLVVIAPSYQMQYLRYIYAFAVLMLSMSAKHRRGVSGCLRKHAQYEVITVVRYTVL